MSTKYTYFTPTQYIYPTGFNPSAPNAPHKPLTTMRKIATELIGSISLQPAADVIRWQKRHKTRQPRGTSHIAKRSKAFRNKIIASHMGTIETNGPNKCSVNTYEIFIDRILHNARVHGNPLPGSTSPLQLPKLSKKETLENDRNLAIYATQFVQIYFAAVEI